MHRANLTTPRLCLLLVLLACAPYLRLAHGSERVGDRLYVHAFEQHEAAVTALEDNLLALIETTPEDERFELYRTYNQLMGTWLQMEFLQSLMDASIAALLPIEEEEIRTSLRDQAQFTLGELDHAIANIEQNLAELDRPRDLQVNEEVRSLLSGIRATVSRLLVDQCERMPCAAVP